jgi:hypothetical protein
MVSGIIASLFANGAAELGAALVNEGKEKIVASIKDKTGLDLNVKTKLTDKDIATLKQYEKDHLSMAYKDIQHARSTHLKLMNSDAPFIVKANRTIMGWIVVLGFFFTVVIFSMFELKIGESIQVMIISTLSTLLGMVYQALFGGQVDTEALNKVTDKG